MPDSKFVVSKDTSDKHLKKQLVLCKRGTHDLQTIYAEYNISPCTDYAVRWCSVCGSVVVDLDDAGRIFPGRIMKMKSPAIAKHQLKK